MKNIKRLVFLLLFFCFCLVSFSDVYKYKDEKGRVYFVDSIYQVPLNYRSKVTVLPSGKDVNKLDSLFAKNILKYKKKFDAGKSYRSYILKKTGKWLIISVIILLFFLIFSFLKGDFFVNFNLFVIYFLFVEFLYLFVIYPEVKRTTKLYSYLVGRYYSVSIIDKVKKFSLEEAILTNPQPLNPIRLKTKIDNLSLFYSKLSKEANIDKDR